MKKLLLGALLMGMYMTGCSCVKETSSLSQSISSITNTISSTINNTTSNTDKTSSIISSLVDDISSVFDSSNAS